MGRFSGNSSQGTFRVQKLPIDASTLALHNDACHCVADAELENRYNTLRAEEHARKEGKCGPEWSCEIATRPENKKRNRYPSVLPWDHSRVLLPVHEGENDYINASWVQLGSRTYIATQGPLPSTTHAFWQMVYAYGGEPSVIIMLTPLYEHSVEKSAKYWPDSKQHPVVLPVEAGFKFGLTISLISFHKNEQYHYSTFKVVPSDKSMPERLVHHLYYFSWLDYSKPNADADLRSLIHLVNNQLRNRASPPIVHCSAGIGRTGTFIALDALLTRIDTDIFPVAIPRVCPVWKGPQQVIQFRQSLFTGAEDHYVESDSGSPLLSKFDVKSGSVANSIRSHPNNPAQMGPLAEKFDSETGSTSKRLVPPELKEQHSYLTAALAQKKAGEKPLEEDSPGTTAGGDLLENEDQNNCIACGDDGGSTTFENQETETELCSVGVPDDEVSAAENSPPRKSSALSGPVIRKVAAKITSVAPEVFSETPSRVDVLNWYDPQDPVMSAIRTMRKQRPKMVQGKQQLGYIYDQFEVGQQLARATHQPNQVLRRRSTVSSIISSHVIGSGETPRQTPKHSFLSLVGLRRPPADPLKSETDAHSGFPSLMHRKKSIFGGSSHR